MSYSQDLLLRKYKCICTEGEMTRIVNFMNREYLCSGGFFCTLKTSLCLLLKTGVKLLTSILYWN